jgi:hypothetical protein
MMFLVLLRHSGPEWDLKQPMDQQSNWREHADYMDKLVDAGVIVLGGPLDEVRVVLAVEAGSEETVRGILARDPWSETHLVVDTIDAWSLRLDGRKDRL